MSREPDLAKRAVWRLRLREFDRGNTTVAEFCRRVGVSVAAFYQWRRKMGPSAAPDASAASRGRAAEVLSFLPVEITGGASIEVLLPSGARVTVPCHDREAIRTVMVALLSASLKDHRPEGHAC
jgi:hypothetical protein